MSIERLKADLVAITSSLENATDLRAWVRDELLPLLESQLQEMTEMDESIGDIFHQAEDVLHAESSALFMAVITSGSVIAAELRTRAGDDRRLLSVIKEFTTVSHQAKELLGEITLVDEEESEDDEDDDEAEGKEEGKDNAPVSTEVKS